MFRYCPGCDDELADIGQAREVCLDCYLAEVLAGPQEERFLAMIEALGDRPLHAISIKMYCKKMEILS